MAKPYKSELHEEPITWDKLVASCDYYHGKGSSCICGVGTWRNLPTVVTTLNCRCEKNYFDKTASLSAKGGPLGTYCLDCGKPNGFSLVRAALQCEGCYKWFVHDWRTLEVQTTWPPPNILCKDCDVPNPVRRSRRKGIRFN